MNRRIRSDAWMSAADAMAALCISKWTLARLRKRGELHFRKENARVFLYNRASVRRRMVMGF